MKKWMITALLVVGIIISSVGCGDSWEEELDTDPTSNDLEADSPSKSFEAEDTWAIYWYLCGSDLESEGGAATEDLMEMMEVTLPENVTVVIQTGGARQWMSNNVDATCLQRFIYRDGSMELVEEQDQASMGDGKTLQSFLGFCEDNYPADHKMVLFWNHGGGSVGGVACDENYDFDALSLTEMDEAFSNIYEGQDIPLELVGFDTCLMSTLDTANVFKKYSSYLVASEELEPGNGWNYNGWLTQLGNNTGMDGAELGTIICDTFVEGCEEYDTADEITLAVTDLGKLDALLVAFNGLGKEILSSAIATPSVCGEFARSAQQAENYGGNNRTDGYTNMVDLGDVVKNAVDILPETSEMVLNALDEAVIYKVNGPYRQNANGLSIYYSYNGDTEELEKYGEVAADAIYPSFIQYSITGKLPEEIDVEYEIPENQEIATLEKFEENMPVEITEENYARLTINPDQLDYVKSVFFNLSYYSEEDNTLLLLGRDNDLNADWEQGIFEDNYRGVWGALDGSLCYMEITYEGEDYNLYSVPIYLNGKECSMRVVYDYEKEAFEILGAREEAEEESLMGDKNLIHIKAGDKVAPILYAMSMEESDDEIYEISDEIVTITDETAFEEMELGDGTYGFMFEIVDTSNTSYDSDMVLFEAKDGDITFLTD